MAVTAANVSAHHLPLSMAIPAMPRIRPPRLLKGEPHPNNAPVPWLLPKHRGEKWVQGKWRKRTSKAVKSKRAVEEAQLFKVLRNGSHGLNIYAYRHLGTNQVVYSLSRTLQTNKVLSQLLYHGKKTVPAEVRRDMWTPYYSIHFPPTPAGALEGLFAFQKLRELSMQRQLSPPEDLIRATQKDIDAVKYRLGSPATLQELAVQDKLTGKIPKLNEILPKKLRAKKLMDQKATSVADAAFVLDWILSGPSPWERVTKVATSRAIRISQKSRKQRARANTIRAGDQEKANEIRKRAFLAVQGLDKDERTSLGLTLKALRNLSMEYQIPISQQDMGSFVSQVGKRWIDLRTLDDYVPADALKSPGKYSQKQHKERQTLVHDIRARQEVAKKAEQESLKEWFEQNDSPVVDSESVWGQVSMMRDKALGEYDAQERKRIENLSASSETEPPKQESRESAEPSDSIQAEVESLKPDWASEPREVKMYWADLNDGLFAPSWSKGVIHGSLAPYALAETTVWKRGADEEGKRLKKTTFLMSKSVHVMGRGAEGSWSPGDAFKGTGTRQPPVWADPPAWVEPGQPEQQTFDDAQYEDRVLDHGSMSSTSGRISGTSGEDISPEPRPTSLWGRVTGMFGR